MRISCCNKHSMHSHHSPLMGMAWERPPLHPIHPGMVSHNQEVLLLLVLAPPLGVKTTAAAVAVSQVADLLQPSPSLGTAGPARDPREVKSEPPQSPRPMDCEAEPAASTVEIPCVEPAEPNPGAPEPVETATVATPGSWPAQGQTESMDGSWNVLSDIATEESVEMED